LLGWSQEGKCISKKGRGKIEWEKRRAQGLTEDERVKWENLRGGKTKQGTSEQIMAKKMEKKPENREGRLDKELFREKTAARFLRRVP